MSGGRCYLRRGHEQLARTETSCEGKEIAKMRRNAAKLVAWTYSLRKNSMSPSFRAKRGIPPELVAKKREGFLASLGMTAIGAYWLSQRITAQITPFDRIAAISSKPL